MLYLGGAKEGRMGIDFMQRGAVGKGEKRFIIMRKFARVFAFVFVDKLFSNFQQNILHILIHVIILYIGRK